MLKSNYTNDRIEAGCDEAGRGCLAGPVVAAAVILPPGFKHKLLNDSKQLNEKIRLELRWEIMEKATAWAIGSCSPKEIDQINILKASFLAMHKAIDQLKQKPELLLIDGNRFTPYPGIEHHCIIGGDAKYLSIAAASILAKTERDMLMEKLHEEFPLYHWNQNKGYPTASHRKAIERFGSCIHHRKSFTLLPPQLSLDI
ncbi:MAG: ribonuclease HII [Flavobacteriales bacterium]|nr:ribonuclease HII [Flavobacteriales bacterium]